MGHWTLCVQFASGRAGDSALFGRRCRFELYWDERAVDIPFVDAVHFPGAVSPPDTGVAVVAFNPPTALAGTALGRAKEIAH